MNGYKKEFIKRVFICVLLILLCYFAVYFIIGTRTKTNIHHNRNGTDTIRNELRNIKETQREEKRTIERTGQAITNSTESVRNSERTNKEIESIGRKDGEIITECQSILKRVRERNKSEN